MIVGRGCLHKIPGCGYIAKGEGGIADGDSLILSCRKIGINGSIADGERLGFMRGFFNSDVITTGSCVINRPICYSVASGAGY